MGNIFHQYYLTLMKNISHLGSINKEEKTNNPKIFCSGKVELLWQNSTLYASHFPFLQCFTNISLIHLSLTLALFEEGPKQSCPKNSFKSRMDHGTLKLNSKNISQSDPLWNSTEKSHKCNQCEYASSRSGNLRMHMYTHSGEKFHKCNQCNFASYTASQLTSHVRKHTGETQWRQIKQM